VALVWKVKKAKGVCAVLTCDLPLLLRSSFPDSALNNKLAGAPDF
jgi:hypothetical protein